MGVLTRRLPVRAAVAAALAALPACAAGPGLDGICALGEPERWSLPSEIDEASGLAVSRTHAGLVWTHNDGDEGVLYGLELPAGGGRARVVARVQVPGPFQDVEDLDMGPCGEGWCLYLADTGDNAERRDRVTVVVVAEPAPGDSVSEPGAVRRLALTFPDGPRDVEAMVVLGGAVHLLSKGRSGPPTWYRAPADAGAGPHVLQPLGSVGVDRPATPDMITGAALLPGPDGRVLVRSYQGLEVHDLGGATVRRVAGPVTIRHLGEPQGEAVAVTPDTALLLASEAGPMGRGGGVIRLRCAG